MENALKNQLRDLSKFLDPHLLIHLLGKNGGKEAEGLIKEIQGRLLGADAAKANAKREELEKAALKLLSLLGQSEKCKQLRQTMKFTLQELEKSEKITIADCQALFDYSQVLYELQRYKDADKYLVSLKEILANESSNHNALVTQVFWGLLATEIINSKAREEIELRSLRKLKDLVRGKNTESNQLNTTLLSQFQFIQHWILVASFTAQKSSGLFAALLADRVNFGDQFINVMRLTNQSLIRYMVASFLLGRSVYQPQPDARKDIVKLQRNALPVIALPIIMAEKDNYSDSFTQFTETLFEEFDFEGAIELAEKLAKDAENDILLRPHAAELRRQALLYVFETETRLYKTGIDLTTFCEKHKIAEIDTACREVQDSLNNESLIVSISEGDRIGSQVGRVMQIQGTENDVKGQIEKKSGDLTKRTMNLMNVYKNQVSNLQNKEKPPA